MADRETLVERVNAVADELMLPSPRRAHVVREAASELSRLKAKVEELERQTKNLQARLTARAKSMLSVRDALTQIHDHTEDEGDRVYFGSTNDADKLHEVWHDLDGWAWDDFMADGKLPDIYEISRKAHARAEAAEAQVADLSARLARAVEVIRPFAEAANGHDEPDVDWARTMHSEDAEPVRVSLGNCRKARAFLSEQENRHGNG